MATMIGDATIPGAWYSDPRVFKREQQLIFSSSWQLACPDACLPPGSCYPIEICNVPVVLTCDDDGSVRAFLNACRHRGYPVATRSEGCRSLRCAYHAWVYSLDGALRKAPRSAGEPDFALDDLSLIALPTHVWQGCVFVNLSSTAPPFEDTYPELEAIAQGHAFDLGEFDYFTSSDCHVDANWKAWTENLNECYHCSAIHAKSFGDAWDVVTESYEWEIAERVIGQIARPNPRAHYFKQAVGSMVNLFLWPNTAVSIDDYAAVAASIVPLSVEQTKVVSHVYVRRGAKAAILQEWFDMANQTLAEDVAVVERQFKSFVSLPSFEGRLMPVAEPGVLRFQQLVRDALAPRVDAD